MASTALPYSTDVKEKESAGSIKDVESSRSTEDDEASEEFVRKTLKRVDWRILPLLIAVYALALMDRGNLGVARVTGMEKDLRLDKGERYSIASAIYFPPYIILELPSNLALRRIGPAVWLSFITVSWGAVQLGEGFVPTWGYLSLCRTLLGAGEAGFFPAIAYIISTWYTRYEVQKRFAVFYLCAVLIGGFSSILGYGMSLLAGKQGLNGWQWIFILQGATTMLLGVLVFFFVTDFPDKNKFLTQKETELILRRVEKDRGDSMPDALNVKKVLKHLSDWKVWVFGLMFMTQTMPAYFVGFFISIILKAMGWNTRDSLLLSAPPSATSLVSAMFFAWLSDRTRLRAPFLAIQTVITMVGLFITAYHPAAGVRYFGLYLVSAGSAGCIPGILAYSSNNFVSQSKRAVGNAIIIAFGGIGGVFATTAFRQKDFPRYVPGLWATIGCQFLNLILLAVMSVYFHFKNKKVREGRESVIEGREGFFYTL